MDKMIRVEPMPKEMQQTGRVSDKADPSLFGVARQLIAKLRLAGETLETANGRISSPRECVEKDPGCSAPKQMTLKDLLEEADHLAHQVANEANDLAAIIGE